MRKKGNDLVQKYFGRQRVAKNGEIRKLKTIPTEKTILKRKEK